MKRKFLAFALILLLALSAMTMVACTKVVKYHKVTFDYNYQGSEPTIISVKDGESVGAFTPARENHVFSGWYSDAACNDECNIFAFKINENKTVYAKWNEIETSNGFCQVTFMNDDIDFVVTVAENSLVHPLYLERTGYTLLWLADSEEFDFSKPVTNDVTLTAQWVVKSYTITYLLDDGVNDPSNPSDYTVEDTFTLNEPSKKYRIFTGWTGTGLTDITKTVTITEGTIGNLTFKANWELKATEGLKYTLMSGNIAYEVSAGTALSDGNKEIVIPSNYKGLPVASIAAYSFAFSAITSLEIGSNVKLIGAGAFTGCYSLTEIIIPNGVTSIGDQAFANCISISSLTIPNSVINLGSFAFFGCDNIASVSTYSNSIPETDGLYLIDSSGNIVKENGIAIILKNKDSHVLSFGINALESIIIPNTVTGIGGYAFAYCDMLSSVILPESVISIANFAFYECTALISISIPGNMTFIDNYVFYNCCNMTTITLPETIASIGISAFNNCSSLVSFKIPDGVKTIDMYAFYQCSSLESLTIPSGVTSIDPEAFLYCDSLSIINTNISAVPNGDGLYIINKSGIVVMENGIAVIIKKGDSHVLSLVGCTVESIIVPEIVTDIGPNAFTGCINLTSILIPNGVTSIGDYAFYECFNLVSITIPNSVTTIGASAFYCCFSLLSIIIPDSVVTINDYAFSGCLELTVYAEAASKPSGWSDYWNSYLINYYVGDLYRPVIWGCNIDYNNEQPYVVSFTKSGDVENADGLTLMAPYRHGYVFEGWFSNAELTETPYSAAEIANAPDGTYYAKWTVI